MDTKDSLKRHDSLARKLAQTSKKSFKHANPVSSRFCGHCNQNLSVKVFKRHERLYKKLDQSWILSGDDNDQRDSRTDDIISDPQDTIPLLPTFPMVTEYQGDDDIQMTNTVDDLRVDAQSESSSEYSGESDDGEEIWELSEDESDDDELCMPKQNDSAKVAIPARPTFMSGENSSAESLVKWIVGFFIILQARYHVPNAAIDLLLKFLLVYLHILGGFSPFVRQLHNLFPASLHIMRTMFVSDINFSKYPVCPKCNQVYASIESCVEKVGSIKCSKACSYIRFPRHPYRSRRTPCKAVLLKSVQYRSGQTILYPFKVFCYSGLTVALQTLLRSSSFLANCELWRSRPSSNNLSDIYDGRIWKEFLLVAGTQFLAAPYTFGLMLNMDWFQPYTHTVYSVGVIYLTIINLPRALRFKRENIIIVGIIPGPREPEHDVNPYLEPLVAELLNFWSGVSLEVANPSGPGFSQKVIKCALLCISCDLPAARKACGFLSFTARLGCSRCLKEFSGRVGEQRDYSGFDRSQWTSRSDVEHRDNVKKLRMCTSKAELMRAESEFGCRYSCLLDLPYFSPIRFVAIDPMHNLFLGTGKRFLSVWMDFNLITKSHFDQIQLFVDSITVPSDIGRIPTKISSGFSGFKADQFKAWITIYSIPALYNILSSDHLECWRHFVLACRILCKQSLSELDVILADGLLLQFCSRIERLYGKASITPNMHLHGHIKEVVLDYGPIQEFWCYSFERFNGILGKQPTSNRAIEPQLLKQFLLDNTSTTFDFPNEFKENFAPLDLENTKKLSARGSVLDTIVKKTFLFPLKHKRCVFSLDDIECLKSLYLKLNPHHTNISIRQVYKKYSSVTLNGRLYGSSGLSGKNPSIVLARWNEIYFGTPPTTLDQPTTSMFYPNLNDRPVDIHYYATVSCKVNSGEDPGEDTEYQEWTLAHVSWLFPHPKRFEIGKPAELWCSTLRESYGLHSFLPLDFLLCRCAHGPFHLDEELLLVVVPLTI